MITPETEVRTGVLLAPLGVLGVTPSSLRSMPGPVFPKIELNRIVFPAVPNAVATPGPMLYAMTLPPPAAPIVAPDAST